MWPLTILRVVLSPELDSDGFLILEPGSDICQWPPSAWSPILESNCNYASENSSTTSPCLPEYAELNRECKTKYFKLMLSQGVRVWHPNTLNLLFCWQLHDSWQQLTNFYFSWFSIKLKQFSWGFTVSAWHRVKFSNSELVLWGAPCHERWQRQNYCPDHIHTQRPDIRDPSANKSSHCLV